jgi:predicted ATPase/class 3 adenylate cyclase
MADGDAVMIGRPLGTVTFLFTDIEASTRLWEEQPEAMRVALARHDAVLHESIEGSGGWLVKHTGDGVVAAFASARSAVDAAVMAQRRLELPVRMGICTGAVETRNDDYFGPALNRAARTMEAAHAGQVLVAAATAAIVEGVEFLDLGEHRLRDLSQPQRLYQLRAEGLQEIFPAIRTLDRTPGNLPIQATSFLGREKDLVEVATLLGAARLVTLTGVGGVGKTRLALQVAGEIAADYPDGAWLVELAALGDPDAIGHAVAGALGIAQQSGRTIAQSLVAALSRRRLLLLLDNCEHLLDAAAALAEDIITQCPQVAVLATSREALMVEGERIWPVPSLAFRGGLTAPAVTLFAERARAVMPQFQLEPEAEAVGDICRRLDGIPLAIELAAARIRVMSPVQIRSRLDDRFRLLTGGSRRALERHQTLRHAVQWSYDLLVPAERILLARCSAFAGGFTLEAVEHGCSGSEVEAADVLDLLDSLVRKSLITSERSGEAMRYGLLETIRQFAEEQLATAGEAEIARRRHAEFFVADSDAHFQIWRSPRQGVAHRWLEREIDNLRVAFRWAVERADIDTAARIASNIGDMGRFCLREEAASWFAEIVDEARRARHRRLAVLLTWAGSSAWAFGRLEEGKRYGEEAISLAGNPEFDPFVWAYGDLAFIAAYQGDVEHALELAQAGAAQDADREDRMCLAHVPYFMAVSGRRQEARAVAGDIVAKVEAAGLPVAILTAYLGMGHAFADTDARAAAAAFERVVAVAQNSGNLMFETVAIPQIAALQARSGNLVDALGSFRTMLNAWHGTAEAMLVSHGIGGLVVLFERLSRREAAALLCGILNRVFPSNPFVEELPSATARLRHKLGEPAFDDLTRRGAAMDLHEAIDYAQEQIEQALSELARAPA